MDLYDGDRFRKRLIHLREELGLSARELSLSLGQSPGYIHAIESGQMYPSLSVLFDICFLLGVSPSEFFADRANSILITDIDAHLQRLNSDRLQAVLALIQFL